MSVSCIIRKLLFKETNSDKTKKHFITQQCEPRDSKIVLSTTKGITNHKLLQKIRYRIIKNIKFTFLNAIIVIMKQQKQIIITRTTQGITITNLRTISSRSSLMGGIDCRHITIHRRCDNSQSRYILWTVEYLFN